ncbi:MAG: reverse transcriptase domain-containing protein [Candidatus Altimarinota bacterium]
MEFKKLIEDLFIAYYDARKNKRNTNEQIRFESELEKNIFSLAESLFKGEYKISSSIFFIQNHPIKREVFASSFYDRVVHHLIYNRFYSIFDNWFIFDSYSCRVGKGTSFGIKRINKFIKSCSNNYKDDSYILKLDIQGYFMSINKEILFQIIKNKLQKYDIEDFDFWEKLLKQVIFHNYTESAIFKGQKRDYVGLPKSKSLFFSGENYGLPIGNLTSQLFSNIYLDGFDKFIKSELKCKYYGRYVDDFIIIHKNKDFLVSIIPKIKDYLEKELKLTLHPKKVYLQHYTKGVLFLGAYLKPHRNYIRKRTLGYFVKKILYLNDLLKVNDNKINYEIALKFLSTINSYLGMLKHYKSYKIRKKILKFVSPYFWNYFYISNNFTKIKNKYGNIGKFTSLQN